MSVDATMAVLARRQPEKTENIDRMTIGQLAAMIEEMQHLLASIGAQVESQAQPVGVAKAEDAAGGSRADDAMTPAEIESLAALLRVIERARSI